MATRGRTAAHVARPSAARRGSVPGNTLSQGCSCLALREAARHVSRLYDEALAPAALGVNQFSVLAMLAHSGPASLSALAGHLVMDRSTLGHLLRPLERRDLVTIGPGADDRRQRLVALTARGTTLVGEARPLWLLAERAFQRSFGARRSAALKRLLGIAARIEIAPGRRGSMPNGEMT
ncbi:MAG: MarR family winged helix-turn-helix transcriptional regulator [Acetobacteraceae bacterium]